MSEEKPLKPCPFCGGEAKVGVKTFDIFNVGAYVFCAECGSRTSVFNSHTGLYRESERMAVNAWNNRAVVKGEGTNDD